MLIIDKTGLSWYTQYIYYGIIINVTDYEFKNTKVSFYYCRFKGEDTNEKESRLVGYFAYDYTHTYYHYDIQ